MADKLVQPPAVTPLVDTRQRVTAAWLQFFVALVARPPAVEAQTLDAAPASFSFTASRPGSILIQAGTVSAVGLTRGRDTIVLVQTSGWVPVAQADVVDITYTVKPNVWFVAAQ